MVNGFFFKESPSTINFGFQKILPSHTAEQRAKIMKHNIHTARKLMGTGVDLPFANDKKKACNLLVLLFLKLNICLYFTRAGSTAESLWQL